MDTGKYLKILGFVFCTAALSGCSDDGDTDSGSGGDNASVATPTVDNSPLDESGIGSLRVAKNGRVGGSVVDDRGDLPCNTTSNTAVVNANGRFTYVESGTCDASSEGLGTCDVSIAVNGAINGNRMSGSGPVELKCNIATATGSVTFSGTRG